MTHRPHRTNPISAVLATTGAILTGLTAAATLALGGCRAPQPAHFDTIRPGMTSAEVVNHLGRPTSRVDAPEGSGDANWASRWHWGDTLSTLATHAAMPEQPPAATVWTVWFDQDGIVVALTPPSRQHNRAAAPPWEPPALPDR